MAQPNLLDGYEAPAVRSVQTVSGEMAVSRPQTGAGSRTVLIVDDEPALCRALERILRRADFQVTTTTDPSRALEMMAEAPFDVILSDLVMNPGMSGVELLRLVRSYDLDVPVILMTGSPTLETAVEAVSLGALQYLHKPTGIDVLVSAVERASQLHRVAVMKREALGLLEEHHAEAGQRADLESTFTYALGTMWMAFQPIVSAGNRGVYGYEALMRTKDKALATPHALLDAAEKLGRTVELGRRVRDLSARAFERAPRNAVLFVNLHPRDLLDPELYESTSPLGCVANRVVLEITERTDLDGIRDIGARLAVLRYMGFRIAIDDLGAGYAGLSSFAALEPEIVKLDMSLVRNVNRSPIRRHLIESMTSMCKKMGIKVVAEGIETEEERLAVCRAGCDLLQGYLFGKPNPLLVSVR